MHHFLMHKSLLCALFNELHSNALETLILSFRFRALRQENFHEN